jgi:hypothetical protein
MKKKEKKEISKTVIKEKTRKETRGDENKNKRNNYTYICHGIIPKIKSNTKAASERARQPNPTHTLSNAAGAGYLEWRSTRLYEKRQGQRLQ